MHADAAQPQHAPQLSNSATEPVSHRQAHLASALKAMQSDGFYIERGVFAAETMADLALAAEQALAAQRMPALFDQHHTTTTTDPLHRFPRMLQPHAFPQLPIGQLAQCLATESVLRDLCTVFLNDEPCLAQSMYYFKPPGSRGQDMHQDDFYLRSAPQSCVAAWVAVDQVDHLNGGLQVVVGSHILPILPVRPVDKTTYFADDAVTIPDGFQLSSPVLAPGDVLFFSGRTIHGSGPNNSPDRFRRSFIVHYVGAHTTALNPWNSPIQTWDGKEIEVPEAPCGPWKKGSFAAASLT